MKRILTPILLCVALLFCGGCSLEEARSTVDRAAVHLEQAEAHHASAVAALEVARNIAEAIDNDAARKAVALAESAVAEAAAAVPIARDSLAAASAGLAAAQAGRGWSVMEWLIAGAGVALTGGGGLVAALKARNWAAVARHGLQVANALKHRAEAANVPVADILEKAAVWQEATGTHALVEANRRPVS